MTRQLHSLFAAVLAAAVLSVTVSPTLAQNIVLNPGFEAGTGGDADNWEELGGPAGSTTRSGAMPNSGNFSAYMEVDHINNPPAAAAYFIQQVQPVGSIDDSLNYNLSFSAKSDTTDFSSIDLFAQIQWLDQDGSNGGGVRGESLFPLVAAGINDSYQPFSFNDLDAADGADSFLIRFQLSPGPVPGIDNGLYVDDVSLTAVPEPTSFGLLGLSGLLALALRRRV